MEKIYSNRRQRVAVIGAGVSGLTVANLLKERCDVTVFEKESTPGGLIRCKREEDGSLFHICGGHVFNTKRKDVLDWFWQHFDSDKEFVKADRNSVVFMPDGVEVPYPIENHMYKLGKDVQLSFIHDLLSMSHEQKADNFEDFLIIRFGRTLYDLYFKPYNTKVWRRPLNTVPLSWLEGKLPMPTVVDMIYNNFNHVEEKEFVHSSFWYEKNDGSQFIANRLAEGLCIRCNQSIEEIEYADGKWMVAGETYDKVIFCGNIKQLPSLLKRLEAVRKYDKPIEALEYHGTTSVFCEIDENPYSWIYQPSEAHQSHRIICTGNFSKTNNSNGGGRLTGTIEFTDYMPKEEIMEQLKLIPLHPQYKDHHYSQYTYPIQDANTRTLIKDMKADLAQYGFYMTGRFADWEYYNMDVAMGAAMDMCDMICNN